VTKVAFYQAAASTISHREVADRLNANAQHLIFAWGVVPEDFHKRQIPPDIATRGIAKVTCGQGHALILTNTGLVLTAGDNRYGQCARDPANQSIPLAAFNLEAVKIVDIAAGSYHSLLLGEGSGKRKVFSFGHELGSGFEDKQHRSTPTELALPLTETERIKAVYAGFNHSAMITQAGKLFMWGEFFTGERVRRAKQIRTDLVDGTEIKKIALGRKHAVMLEGKR
jgi:alpha-tubulin suppressor-like RCC1 family protein